MGADLIGYLVVGPERIPDDDGTVGAIADRMDAHAARIDGLFQQDEAAREEAEPSGEEAWLLDELDSRLDDEAAGRIDPVTIARAFDTTGVLPDGIDSTEALARYLVHAWNELIPGARDVAFRTAPGDDDRRIVFAGDQTWGDDPEGTGYVLLRLMNACGFAAAAGIE